MPNQKKNCFCKIETKSHLFLMISPKFKIKPVFTK